MDIVSKVILFLLQSVIIVFCIVITIIWIVSWAFGIEPVFHFPR